MSLCTFSVGHCVVCPFLMYAMAFGTFKLLLGLWSEVNDLKQSASHASETNTCSMQGISKDKETQHIYSFQMLFNVYL